MGPELLTERHFIQFSNADTIFVGWHFLRNNIHSDFAEKQICSDTCGRRDACRCEHIPYHSDCKLVSCAFVSSEVICCIYENLVNRINVNVFGSNIFKIHVVNPCADLHILCHLRRCNDIRDSKLRSSLQLGVVVRFAYERSLGGVPLPLIVDRLDFLHDLKQARSARHTVAFQRRGDRKANCFFCSAFIGNDQVCCHRVQSTLHTFNGGIERFKVDCNIASFFHRLCLRF